MRYVEACSFLSAVARFRANSGMWGECMANTKRASQISIFNGFFRVTQQYTNKLVLVWQGFWCDRGFSVTHTHTENACFFLLGYKVYMCVCVHGVCVISKWERVAKTVHNIETNIHFSLFSFLTWQEFATIF